MARILVRVGACAQVPRESVELSSTVGRDIAEVYRPHRELANVLYDRIEADVNRFVDEVYAPYHTSKLLSADHADFQAGNENSLFFVSDAAVRQQDDRSAQQAAVELMDVLVRVVRQEVEAYREERLAPVLAQRQQVLSAIDRSYNQIHYANSIVTGHLASMSRSMMRRSSSSIDSGSRACARRSARRLRTRRTGWRSSSTALARSRAGSPSRTMELDAAATNDLIGLGGSLLRRGARAVIGSRWPVYDDFAADFMATLYGICCALGARN